MNGSHTTSFSKLIWSLRCRNEQRATSNEQRATSYQASGFRPQASGLRLQASGITGARANVLARSSRTFGVMAERAFDAVRMTLGLLAVCFFSVYILVMQFGCSGQSVASSGNPSSSVESSDPSRPAPISLTKWRAENPEAFKTPEQPLVIDAGIVFAGQPTYLCFPIEKFGITNADDIIDITTSCECVTVEKVQYRDVGGEVKDALKIRVTAGKSTARATLRVSVNLLMTNFESRDFEVLIE